MRRSGHAARRLPTKRAALRRPVRSPPQSRHEDRRTPTGPAGSVICQRTFSAVAIRNELPGRRRAAPRPACEGSPEYSFYGSGKISTLRNNFNHREHAFAKRDVMLLLHKKKAVVERAAACSCGRVFTITRQAAPGGARHGRVPQPARFLLRDDARKWLNHSGNVISFFRSYFHGPNDK